jgi:hypothetical protein
MGIINDILSVFAGYFVVDAGQEPIASGRRVQKRRQTLHWFRNLNRFLGTPFNDRIVKHVDGFVRDTHPFSGARISCQEAMRFFGIGFNWLTVAQMAQESAHQANVS